jgi:hypothetical protein
MKRAKDKEVCVSVSSSFLNIVCQYLLFFLFIFLDGFPQRKEWALFRGREGGGEGVVVTDMCSKHYLVPDGPLNVVQERNMYVYCQRMHI